ncbi:MAG: hypothetical protein M1524_03830 [Patescibacteria group bacterium]|nr:hypothetical protein [Patescibacteria group bacterium]
MINIDKDIIKEEGENKEELIHKIEDTNNRSIFSMKLLIFLVIVVILGVGTGFLFSKNSGKLGPVDINKIKSTSNVAKGEIVGSEDTKTFKDTAEGVLKEGGVDGEGQYHLVRPGGDSQNVYLTSSIVDLSKYVDRKVKVWGETQKAQKAGWLMDVGRLEVLD